MREAHRTGLQLPIALPAARITDMLPVWVEGAMLQGAAAEPSSLLGIASTAPAPASRPSLTLFTCGEATLSDHTPSL